MGEGSFWIDPRSPLLSFPGCTFVAEENPHGWDQRTTRVLQNVPLSLVALGNFNASHSPRGVLASTEFGKHRKQTPS